MFTSKRLWDSRHCFLFVDELAEFISFCEGLLWDYKDHLSETVWVSLRPITAFSAVACVQSLINVKKYWKKLYHFVCRRRREIIYHQQNWIIIMQTLEHDTTRLWGKQLKIVHFDIWCRLEVGCSEMPVKCQYCFKLNDAFVFIYRCCQLNS